MFLPEPVTRAPKGGLALIAILEGDVAKSQELYVALASSRGTILRYSRIAADRLLGLLSVTVGELEAIGHLEDALAFCRKAGCRPELAWTCCDYADALFQRSGPGYRDKATSLLDESLAISTELGMRPLMERVLSRLDLLKT